MYLHTFVHLNKCAYTHTQRQKTKTKKQDPKTQAATIQNKCTCPVFLANKYFNNVVLIFLILYNGD